MLRLFRYSLQAVIFSVLTLLELNQENVTLTFARVFCLALVGEGDLWYPVPKCLILLNCCGDWFFTACVAFVRLVLFADGGFAGAQCCFGSLPVSLSYRPSFLRTQPHHCFVVFLVEMVATSTVSELGVNTCDPIFIQESGGIYLREQSNKRDTILGPAVFGI